MVQYIDAHWKMILAKAVYEANKPALKAPCAIGEYIQVIVLKAVLLNEKAVLEALEAGGVDPANLVKITQHSFDLDFNLGNRVPTRWYINMGRGFFTKLLPEDLKANAFAALNEFKEKWEGTIVETVDYERNKWNFQAMVRNRLTSVRTVKLLKEQYPEYYEIAFKHGMIDEEV